jgi:hypothetical protein
MVARDATMSTTMTEDVLRAYFNELFTERRKLEASIVSLREKLAIVDAKMETLREIKSRLDLTANGDGGKEEQREGEDDTDKLGPSDAVVQMLSNFPEGMNRDALISMLVGRIDTTSSEPRRLLINTIANLVRRGKLVSTEDQHGREKIVLKK